jgi:hypothetical protein
MSQSDPLLFVKMKARRADEHFQSLEKELDKWARNPYTVIEKTDFDSVLHIVQVKVTPTPELVAMLMGDFVCCLRSALDQLAWRLAHLPPVRTFNRTEQRQISFPIFETKNRTYEDRRSLFPSAVADIIDSLQPYLRGNAFKDDPLWQLNELWTLDKHRTIPMSMNSINVGFGFDGWERFLRRLHYDVVVAFPLSFAWTSDVDLKPTVSVEILFGDAKYFDVSRQRLREINDFVRNDVIPRFTGFFP